MINFSAEKYACLLKYNFLKKSNVRIVSGIQPTGKLHIGNYLGAVKQWIDLQEKEECVFFIADLHSMTVPYEPAGLKESILETAASYLAAGVNPKKTLFFAQSQIPEHAFLAWILNTVCPVGELERMTQYKEKAGKFSSNINAGLLTYPILQAADILIYKGEAVPVGKDQVQHIELARTLARKFNQKFGETFPEPKAVLSKEGSKIMSLTDPDKKMSKTSPEGCIFLFEKEDATRKKIMSAVTDAGKEIKYNPESKPGISNLLNIYSLFSGKNIKTLEKEFSSSGYADFKKSLAETLINSLEPLRKKQDKLLSQKTKIQKTLRSGAKKARKAAGSVLEEVLSRTGLSLS